MNYQMNPQSTLQIHLHDSLLSNYDNIMYFTHAFMLSGMILIIFVWYVAGVHVFPQCHIFKLRQFARIQS